MLRAWTRDPGARHVVAAGLCAGVLAGAFWLFELDATVRALLGSAVAVPTFLTLLLVAGLAILCATWPSLDAAGRALSPRSRLAAVVVAIACGAALIALIVGWIQEILLIAIDGNRADMLVQIQRGVERFTELKNPYVVYHVPWELPLSYGPWLWGWYVVPYLLQADFRFVTIIGQAFTPVLLVSAAVVLAARQRPALAAILGASALVVAGSPLLERFVIIGHTPAYWPLIGCFAFAISSRRPRTAAVALAALVGARTTMVALIVPFAIHLWNDERPSFTAAAGWFAATLLLTFGPFALLDWRTLTYGMYGNYVRVIHDFVWPQTNWMASTLGVTRLLVQAGWGGFAGVAQAVAMGLTWILTWRRLKPGASPAPWFVLSLAVFSFTTLWPVWYVFLDVYVLGLCLLATDSVPDFRKSPWRAYAIVATLSIAVVIVAALIHPGAYYTVGAARGPRWYLRSGFGPDMADGERPYAWAMRDRVHVRLPRALRNAATVEIECQPYAVDGAPTQTVGATLNGVPIGRSYLEPGWQVVRFAAPGRAWRIGHNDLVLLFRYAAASPGGDTRAARVGRISITR